MSNFALAAEGRRARNETCAGSFDGLGSARAAEVTWAEAGWAPAGVVPVSTPATSVPITPARLATDRLMRSSNLTPATQRTCDRPDRRRPDQSEDRSGRCLKPCLR